MGQSDPVGLALGSFLGVIFVVSNEGQAVKMSPMQASHCDLSHL